MKNENWQDSEKKYEILVDDMSPLTQAELRRSGVSLQQEDDAAGNEWEESQTETDDAESTNGIGVKRLLLSAAVLCVAAALGVAAGFGIGSIFKQKRPQKAAVSDSSQISSQDSAPEEVQAPSSETPKEVRFDIGKSVTVKNVNFTVLDCTCDDEMLFLTVDIWCNAALIGKSSGKVVNPYMNVQFLPDETKAEIDSLEVLKREGSSFTVKVGFHLPQPLQKDQEVHANFYGASVSREKINPKTGSADVVCNLRQRQPVTVSFVYGG